MSAVRSFTKKGMKKGSILVLSMIFASIISLSLASLLSFQGQYHKLNARNLERTKALNMAQSGIELICHELRKDPDDRWGTGWTVSGSTYTFSDSDGVVYSVVMTGLT